MEEEVGAGDSLLLTPWACWTELPSQSASSALERLLCARVPDAQLYLLLIHTLPAKEENGLYFTGEENEGSEWLGNIPTSHS